jgi:hypothetical protein
VAVAFDAATESVRTGTTDPHTFTHTPVGTPRGVVLAIVHGTSSVDHVSSVTYGGVAMSRVVSAADTATEPGRAYLYFLGSSVPTGAQTVSVDLTTATTDDIQFVCMTVTAAGDTSVIDFDSLSNNVANPSVTLQYGGLTSMAFAALYGGGAGPTDFTPNGSCTTVHDHDFGAFYAEVIRQTTVGSSDFAIGGTAGNDDVAYVALAVSETANVTIDLDTGNIIASAVAAPSTPEGVDITIGPLYTTATASVVAPVITIVNGGGVLLVPPSATATAAVVAPVPVVAVLPSASAATAAVVAPALGITVGPSAAAATAAPAAPEGVDVEVGPSPAGAVAAPTPPTVPSSTSRTVAALQAEATAAVVAPVVSVTVSPSAAAATAAVTAPYIDDGTDLSPTITAPSAQAVTTRSRGRRRHRPRSLGSRCSPLRQPPPQLPQRRSPPSS